MKTFFTEEEIAKFMETEINTIVADGLILKAISPIEKPDFSAKSYTPEEIFSIAMDYAYKLGEAKGNIQGRSDLIKQCLDFFDIEK